MLIEKGVQLKNGGLRLQGVIEGVRIRFTFDESTFKIMKITPDECKNLIVFACDINKKVQTNTGRKVFETRYEIVTQQEPSVDVNHHLIHRYGKLEIISEKHIDFVVIENGSPVMRYSLNYDCYVKYFSGETALSMKTSFSVDGQRIDSARSPSYGMYILLEKISDTIISLSGKTSPQSDNQRHSVSSVQDGKIFIKKITLLKKDEDTSTILLECIYTNTAEIYLIISDKICITQLLTLKENNTHLIHDKKHSLEISGTKYHLIINDDTPSTSLSVSADHISKHLALAMIKATPEYLARVSAKRIKKANNLASKNNKKSQEHSGTEIRFRRKKSLSIEIKIASAAQNLKTPMAEAFKNFKRAKKKK